MANLLRLAKILEKKLPISKTSFYQLIREGKISPPVKIGGRSVAWLESEIDEYIEKRAAERSKGELK